jgi:DNA-binding response OmpR family regulator
MNTHAGQLLHVLIVEDCPDTADSLAVLVRLWGHESRIAPDSATALAAAAERCPGVVILDLGLPDGDGLLLIPRLRGLPGGREALIAVTSGFGRPDDRARSHEAGADVFLLKPVDPDVIRRLLAARHENGTGHDGERVDAVRGQPGGGGGGRGDQMPVGRPV